jgi:hypothetical protein
MFIKQLLHLLSLSKCIIVVVPVLHFKSGDHKTFPEDLQNAL